MKPQDITLVLGADHGGFPFLAELQSQLELQGVRVVNCGADSLDPTDDYPHFAFMVGEKVAELQERGERAYGILLCRSGAGMTIAANKVAGVRAATAHNTEQVAHARQHNDANVLSLSADWLDHSEMLNLAKAFISTPFSAEERHRRRLAQIAEYESSR